MSAVLQDAPRSRAMREADLDEVMAIENAIYTHPWTRGNFADSLRAGYECRTWRLGGELIGYFVLMVAAGEAHLLNLSIAARAPAPRARQRAAARSGGASRAARGARSICSSKCGPSNAAAQALYTRFGFRKIAVRRGYYPAHAGPRGRAGARRSRCNEPARRRSSPRWASRRSGGCVAGTQRSRRAGDLRKTAGPAGLDRAEAGRSPAAPPAGCTRRARRPCSASATSRPTGCWWARRRARRRTGSAIRSSARPASCSTTCSRRSAWRATTNVYIANVLKCRPPGNRNPEPDEVAKCTPYLLRQIELIEPKLIVAMGRFAAQTLLTPTQHRQPARPGAPLRRACR